MANKKKGRKRPYVPPQRAGTGDADAPAKAAVSDAPKVDPKAAERRERKGEVRAQKEKELRRYQRGQFLRKALVAVVVIAVVAGGIGYIVYSRSQKNAEAQAIIDQASKAAVTAGCGPVQTVKPYDPVDQDRTHVTDYPALDTYASIPPTSGPHAGVTQRAGVYDTPPAVIGEAIHSLEHGAVIIWYRPDADPQEIAAIKALVNSSKDHTIMAPYDYPGEGKAGALPEGKDMALVAWHRLQLCDSPSKAVVAEFLSKYREPAFGGGTYEGEAPEAGVLI